MFTYDHCGVEVETYDDALGNLTKDLALTSSGLVIEPLQKTAKSETSTSYVLRHFLNQKYTAKVFVNISVIIAFLGLATPLWFQTATDKILPCSAQGSLLVVVALLLLAVKTISRSTPSSTTSCRIPPSPSHAYRAQSRAPQNDSG